MILGITFTTQRTSNLETMGSVSSTFCEKFFEESYLPPIGLAAAITEQRAWREVTIPAFDMLILCCSMASWILTLSTNVKIEYIFLIGNLKKYKQKECLLPILVIHFVEFIYETYTLISKNKSPSFKSPFSSDWILVDCCCKSYSRSSFSSCVNCPLSSFLNISWKKYIYY